MRVESGERDRTGARHERERERERERCSPASHRGSSYTSTTPQPATGHCSSSHHTITLVEVTEVDQVSGGVLFYTSDTDHYNAVGTYISSQLLTN